MGNIIYIAGCIALIFLGAALLIFLCMLSWRFIKVMARWINKSFIWPWLKRWRYIQYRDYKYFKKRFVTDKLPVTWAAGAELYFWQQKNKDHKYYNEVLELFPEVWAANPLAEEGYNTAKFDAENGIE